jgi:carbamoylphosphate synthase small subunit
MAYFTKDGVMHISPEEFAELCRNELEPAPHIKVCDGHVFIWSKDGKEWLKMPFGYDGYDKPVTKIPKGEPNDKPV